MAILNNGLETMELGVTAWRVIINENFSKLYTKDEIDSKLSAFATNKLDFIVNNIDISGIIAFANALPSATLPAQPLGFISCKVDGKMVKIPYYEL